MPASKRKASAAGSPAKRGKCPYREGRTDGPTRCTWFPGTTEASPHNHQEPFNRPAIMDSALDNIGNTPLIRINKIAEEEGLQCELLAKCEFFNAGGSVKDRIGKRMIEEAEREGRIKPGDTLIEPTSGNTGIGLALAAALKGYRMIITLPEKMSQEKVDVLKALGAEIIRTPTEAAWDGPESHIGVAKRLEQELPNAHILDQYSNPNNPLAHYDQTAREILEQCDGRLDMVVLTAGTGGTLTGVARKLKDALPNLQVVAVDPVGSVMAEPDSLNDFRRLQSYAVEGIGYEFVSTVCDREIADRWIKTGDRDSFLMARRLIRSEGLLCGGSSGSAVHAAVQAAKTLGAGQRCVVLLADSVRNYMTKFLNDGWMAEQGFMDVEPKARDQWWSSQTVGSLQLSTPVTVGPNVSCRDATRILREQGFDILPVVSDSDGVLGVVSEGNITAKVTAGRLEGSDPVSKALFRQYAHVGVGTTLGELAAIFDRDHFALVVTEQTCFTGENAAEPSTRQVVVSVATRIDLLSYITAGPQEGSAAGASAAAAMEE